MLHSKREKDYFFKRTKRHQDSYVRVPSNLSTNVKELRTDVNFALLENRFERSMAVLRSFVLTDPIVHVSMDCPCCPDWTERYAQITRAFRVINFSRVVRKMHVTGLRLINILCEHTGFTLYLDAYFLGLDQAFVVLHALISSDPLAVNLNDHEEAEITFRGGAQAAKVLMGSVLSHEEWRRTWSIERCAGVLSGIYKVRVRARASDIVRACSLVVDRAAPQSSLLEIRFRWRHLRVDLDQDLDLKRRHGFLDVNVLLSGFRIRRMQHFGRMLPKYLSGKYSTFKTL